VETILRTAHRTALTGGEVECEALLKTLYRADKLPSVSHGRAMVVSATKVSENSARLRLTEQAEGLTRCWNCHGILGKGRSVVIWSGTWGEESFFLPFCCRSCQSTYQTIHSQWEW